MEMEVERILKEASLNSGLERFAQKFNQEKTTPPDEEWQEIFNTFFDDLLSEYPALACCILAFTAGQVWQKYQDELLGTLSAGVAMSGTAGIAESLRVIKLLDELGKL